MHYVHTQDNPYTLAPESYHAGITQPVYYKKESNGPCRRIHLGVLKLTSCYCMGWDRHINTLASPHIYIYMCIYKYKTFS